MRSIIPVFIALCLAAIAAPAETIRYEFSQSSADDNGISIQGAGFAAIRVADVAFGAIPGDNAFDGATDGTGAIITAGPGEGVMLLSQPVNTANAGFIRCSARSSGPGAQITIAALGLDANQFLSTNSPGNTSFFNGQYRRLATYHVPQGAGFQAIIQVVNTDPVDTLTVYLDNLEIHLLDPDMYYSAQFLDADQHDPAVTRTRPAPDFTVPLDLPDGALPLTLAYVPGGSFVMGSPESDPDRDDDEHPPFEVTLTRSIMMSKYEITQAQYEAVMGENPSFYGGEGLNLPVERVSWHDAQTFIEQLNTMGMGTFRLPTEAEWEHACRAGDQTRYYWGDDPDYSRIDDYAWFFFNAERMTQPVGLKRPNAFGLYDMSGNVWEWVSDWHGDYPAEPQVDYQGPASGEGRVARGGGWGSEPAFCRSAQRAAPEPDLRSFILGFRVVREM